jgi:alpha-beta hydrolase superfamily lysophospholipase
MVTIPQKKLHRRVLLALVAAALVPLAIAARGFWLEYVSFDTPTGRVDSALAHASLPGLVEVTIPNKAGALRGWFVPGPKRAGVLLLHGCGGNRGELRPVLEILSNAGLTALAIDLPGSGDSAGFPSWGDEYVTSLRTSLDWFSARPEVDPARMGVYAFSMGTWIALRESVGDPRVRALALAGAMASVVDFSLQGPRRALLTLWSGIYADRARGMPIGTDEPRDLVQQLSGRPLLLIAGTDDRIVPVGMTRELFDKAAEPKQLLVVPGSKHGQYAEVGGAMYADRLATFFVQSLGASTSEHAALPKPGGASSP